MWMDCEYVLGNNKNHRYIVKTVNIFSYPSIWFQLGTYYGEKIRVYARPGKFPMPLMS